MLAQHRPFTVTAGQSPPLAFGNDAIGEIVKTPQCARRSIGATRERHGCALPEDDVHDVSRTKKAVRAI